MIVCDVIVCHPRDLLYPQWIKQMNNNRDLFGRIIVVMTQKEPGNNRDYTGYLKDILRRPTIVEGYVDRGQDWRDAAVNEGLKYVISDAVLFLEQDFLIIANDFFDRLLNIANNFDIIGFDGGGRFHPACLLVKKAVLEKTSKDFSVESGIGDHFVKFSRELRKIGSWTYLHSVGLVDYKHLGGLSQNYRLTSNFYQPEAFVNYLRESLRFINLPDDWCEFTKQKIKEAG